MINLNAYTHRFLAGLSAVTMSLTLFVGYFATPQAATFAGVLA